jgi:RHS repeat-associated protein
MEVGGAATIMVAKMCRRHIKIHKGAPPHNKNTRYQSDYLGRMEWIEYPDGEVVTYGYDRGGNVNSVKGQKDTTNITYVEDIGYDAWGQRVYMKLGNGVETRYTYDEKRRWLSTIETKKENTKLQGIKYTFDAVGNVLRYGNNAGAATRQEYDYDSLYQLTGVDGESRGQGYTARYNQKYSFDSQGLGNMTLKTSSTANTGGVLPGDPLDYQLAYEYASGYAHRASRIGNRHYQYDLNGNVTAEKDGAFEVPAAVDSPEVKQVGDVNYVEQGWGLEQASGNIGGQAGYRRDYTWDERNRLKGSADGLYQVQYTYDHGGERTGKYAVAASGGRSETLYFGKLWTWTHHGRWGEVHGRYSKHIFLGESRIATKIVAGDGLHVPRAEELQQYYYHSDHLGSAQLITDYQGEEYERLEYTPYGEVWLEKATTSVLDIAYRFTGKERDEETGNYYYGARYLDPRTARWLSTDPAMGGYVAGPGKGAKGLSGMGGVYNTVNFHMYHYAGNNPVKYVDPDGEFPVIPVIIGIGITMLLRSSSNQSPSVNRNSVFSGMMSSMNSYYDGRQRGAALTNSNLRFYEENGTVMLSSNPVGALAHSMPRGNPQADDYNNDGYGGQSILGSTRLDTAMGARSLAGSMIENMTDNRGHKLGDIRLDYTKSGGSLTEWSIIETEFNHLKGELRDRRFTEEQAQAFLLSNKDRFTNEQYREISTKLGLD